MISLYRTSDGTLYLHQANSASVYQLQKDASFADIEKAIQAIIDEEEEGLQEVALQDVRETLNDPMTDVFHGVDDEVTFLRMHIEQLESDLRLARGPNPMQEPAVNHLQVILDELEGMQPLAPVGSTIGQDAHEAWMAQSRRMTDLTSSAKNYALWVVPTEIQELLRKISDQHMSLCAKMNSK